MVLVDTSVWSLMLRRHRGDLSSQQILLHDELKSLIQNGMVTLLGPIRQEILSGIRSEAQYEKLRDYLRSFPDEPLSVNDYESAARLSNSLLSHGETPTSVDALIASITLSRQWQLFTTDAAFTRWAKMLPLRLYAVR